MIKATFFIVKRRDLSHEQFISYWMNEHLALSRSLPEAKAYVRRYAQQHRIDLPTGALPMLGYDGMAEVWFDCLEDLMSAFGSDNFIRVVGADEEKFIDRAQTRMMITEEKHDLWPMT